MCVEVKGQPEGVGSLLPPRGSWGSNSGCQAWQQALLPDKPFYWPNTIYETHDTYSLSSYLWVQYPQIQSPRLNIFRGKMFQKAKFETAAQQAAH